MKQKDVHSQPISQKNPARISSEPRLSRAPDHYQVPKFQDVYLIRITKLSQLPTNPARNPAHKTKCNAIHPYPKIPRTKFTIRPTEHMLRSKQAPGPLRVSATDEQQGNEYLTFVHDARSQFSVQAIRYVVLTKL